MSKQKVELAMVSSTAKAGRRTTILVLIACLALGLVVREIQVKMTLQSLERNNARQVDAWIEGLRLESSEADKAHAREGIRRMGTNALPELVRLLVYQDGFLKRAYYSRFGRQDIPHFGDIRNAADQGIEVLGESAAQAIPEIMHLIPTVPEICCTLGAIGPVAIPELVAQLTNANALSRASAIAGLRRLGRDAESTVPAVRQAIQDQDSRVRKSAVRMLGDALPSKVNLDALIKCLTDPDMWVRRDAAEAIGKYGEEGVSAIWALTAATTDESAYVAEAAKHAIELINSAFTDEPSEGKR